MSLYEWLIERGIEDAVAELKGRGRPTSHASLTEPLRAARSSLAAQLLIAAPAPAELVLAYFLGFSAPEMHGAASAQSFLAQKRRIPAERQSVEQAGRTIWRVA